MTLEHATRLLVLILYLASAGMGIAAWRRAEFPERRRSAAVIVATSTFWAVFYLYLLASALHASSETVALITRVLHYASACGLFYLAWSIWDAENMREASRQMILRLEGER